MKPRVILVILDGLSAQVAIQCMGYMQGLVRAQKALYTSLYAETPSLSRPLYECLLTGKTPIQSGILHNDVVRLSNHPSVFSRAREAGLTTAAACYHWMSELYNQAPYDPHRDRFTHHPSFNIQHGCFYHADEYPDSHVFVDAEALRLQYQPDFLLVHSMNIDDAGHKKGQKSNLYRNAARHADGLLSRYLPLWMSEGYHILVTSDHGMHADGTHGGTSQEECEVPLYVLGDHWFQDGSFHLSQLKQVDLAHLMIHQLGLNQL